MAPPHPSTNFFKILLVNQTFYPDVASTAQYLTDLAIYLRQAGHQVSVLASRRNYSAPSVLHSKREIYRGIQIERVNSPFLGNNGRLNRMLSSLLVNFSFFWKLLFMPRFDTLVTLTSPPLVAYIAALVAQWKGMRLVYWVMDINPDEAIEAGWIRKNSFQARWLEAALRFSLKRSNLVIALDEFMKLRLLEKGAALEKIRVCAPWAHEEHLELIKHENNPFRKQHGLEDKFVVMYSGNHSICHPLDTVLKAAYELRSYDDIRFVFIGGGARVRDVTEFKERFDLRNILQLSYLPLSDLKYSLSAANLHLVIMGNPFVGIVHPCKIYNILKIRKPFIYIGPPKSHIGELIAEYGGGNHVNHGDVSQLVSTIKQIRVQGNLTSNSLLSPNFTFAGKYSSRTLINSLYLWINGLHHPSSLSSTHAFLNAE